MSFWFGYNVILIRNVSFQFLAFDTQQVMGGRKHEISPEDHVFGAMMLYVDIIYIFLFLLQIFGKSN